MATNKEQGAPTGLKAKWAAFMVWYESYSGQRVVGIVYSAGASVVIVGALFKILHWPGAEIMLMAGMFTEAALFLIGVLDKPHPTYHWEEVFPQTLPHNTNPEILEKYADRPRPTLLGGVGSGNAVAASAASVPTLVEKDLEALKTQIGTLAKTASQLSELEKVAVATNKLGEKAEAAAEAAGKYAVAAGQLSEKSSAMNAHYAAVAEQMAAAEASSKTYAQSVAEMAKKSAEVATKATELTSIYDVQLTAGKTAAKSAQDFEAAQTKLAKQVADLNSVYGNMLTAIA